MPLAPLFGCFRPLIEERFLAARSAGGEAVVGVELRLEEEPLGRGKERAEFQTIDPAGPVRITWNGVASLWALCQGAARLSRRMFDANRQKVERLNVADDPELECGLDSLELAHRFRTEDVPPPLSSSEQWPSWAPPIDADPPPLGDDATGVRFFAGALDFLFRHEIAHIACKHAEREKAGEITYRDGEIEADKQAAEWLRGTLIADAEREPGARPSQQEMDLERRGLAIGLGIIWVALFEAGSAVRNASYPPVAERLADCMAVLDLSPDSGAAEILAHIIKAWIGPEDHWASSGENETVQDALATATVMLHRHLSAKPAIL